MNNIRTDADMDGHRNSEFPGAGQQTGFSIGIVVFNDCFSDRFADAQSGIRTVIDNVIQFAGFLPQAKLSFMNITGDTFGCRSDSSQFIIMNTTGSVQSDMIDQPFFHQINDHRCHPLPK